MCVKDDGYSGISAGRVQAVWLEIGGAELFPLGRQKAAPSATLRRKRKTAQTARWLQMRFRRVRTEWRWSPPKAKHQNLRVEKEGLGPARQCQVLSCRHPQQKVTRERLIASAEERMICPLLRRCPRPLRRAEGAFLWPSEPESKVL